MNALVITTGLETGFIGAWCLSDEMGDVLNAYALNGCYSFDRRLLVDFAIMPANNDEYNKTFKFKFSLNPRRGILVHSNDCGDLLLLTAHFIEESVITSTRTVPLSISRYIVLKRPNLKELPKNFRNLREFSIKLKNELFLPFRNEILNESHNVYPSLQGLPVDILKHDICKYLKSKDVLALSRTCKTIKNAVRR